MVWAFAILRGMGAAQGDLHAWARFSSQGSPVSCSLVPVAAWLRDPPRTPSPEACRESERPEPEGKGVNQGGREPPVQLRNSPADNRGSGGVARVSSGPLYLHHAVSRKKEKATGYVCPQEPL